MKALFYFFVIAVVALVAAGVWIVAPAVNVSGLKEELNTDRLFDRAEQMLSSAQNVFHAPMLDSFVEDRIGACKLMSRGLGGALVPVEGARFPFSVSVALNGNSLLCAFGTQGKSILFNPNGPRSTIRIRRFPKKPGLLSVEDGTLVVVSDELVLLLETPAFVISLRSAEPVKMAVSNYAGRGQISLLKGKLDAKVEAKSGPVSAISPLFIAAFPDTSVTSDGKPVTDKAAYVKVLPSGLEVDPTREAPAFPNQAPPPPAAPGAAPAPVPPPAPAPPPPAPPVKAK